MEDKEKSMGWNKPSEDGRAVSTKPPRRDHRSRPTVRGAVAGAIVVVGATVAWFCRSPVDVTAPSHPEKKSERSAIKESRPLPGTPKIGTPEFRRLPREERIRIRAAEIEARSKMPKFNFPSNYTNKTGVDSPEVAAMRKRHPIPKVPFKEPAEMALMGLLNWTQADYYEKRDFDSRFLEQLRACIDKPIEAEDGDSEWASDLKEAMDTLKKKLKPYLTIGTPEADREILKMLNDEQEAILRDQQTYRDIVDEMRKAEANGAGDEDLVSLEDAANIIMKKRGLNPIKSLRIARLRRKLDNRIKKKEGAVK